jgi:selenocysteine lyase/cysteine desulfurase
VHQLARDFVDDLRDLRHVRIYGPQDRSRCGGAVAFNVCDRVGAPIPYSLVETRARRANVSLRCGCFCNPGASEAAFALDAGIASCLDDLGSDFTPERFAECTKTAVGAVRASFGLANNGDDIRRAVAVVASFGA